MDITNPYPPAPATRPCAMPHSAPAAWLRSAEPSPPPPPEPDDIRRDQIRHHMLELERLSRELGENRATRMGGWTPFNRKLFLDVLAVGGKVSRACEIVDLSKQSAYALRARDPVFAAGWNAAAELARDALADQLFEQAISGSTETITRNGEVVAERHKHDGRLAMAVLARLDRRCDRSAAEGGAHVRAMAEWDRFLELVGEGDDAAAQDLLTPPPPPANDGQPSQADGDGPEQVWRDPDSGEWRTHLPWPNGGTGHLDLWNGRPCVREEAALLDEYFGTEEEEAAGEEERRAAYFAELRAELDEEKAASAAATAQLLAGETSEQPSTGSVSSSTSPPPGNSRDERG